MVEIKEREAFMKAESSFKLLRSQRKRTKEYPLKSLAWRLLVTLARVVPVDSRVACVFSHDSLRSGISLPLVHLATWDCIFSI